MAIGPGESLLVGCAGEWAVEPVCDLVRYRLALGRSEAAEQSADSGAGRSVWARAERATDSNRAGMRHVSASSTWSICFRWRRESLAIRCQRGRGDGRQTTTLSFIADSLARLPSPECNRPRRMVQARHRDKRVIYELLQSFARSSRKFAAAIHGRLKRLNSNIDALDEFLNLQNYRLAYWRTADQELGYRRFFDVNTLIGLRVERAACLRRNPCRVLEWLRQRACSTACASIIPMACAIRSSISSGCGSVRRMRGSSARKSWSRESRCASTGRSKVPAATTF